SPRPWVFFHLTKENRFQPVTGAFWTDYETDIRQAKMTISRDGLAFLTGVSPKGPDDRSKEDERALTETKASVLTVVLSYIYGGRSQDGWKFLADNWADRDKARVRTIIANTRIHGLISEVNTALPQSISGVQAIPNKEGPLPETPPPAPSQQ